MADTFARYERSKGNEVYFPLGLHYSGIEPITLSRDIRNNQGNKEYLSSLAQKFSINEEEISKLDGPLPLLDFFPIIKRTI